ncbi:hypothetical protein ACN4EK_16950 [Pantanalinema rosaneae CENA516]|uniref:hypothetical protein n=1 Tax=Pantanalinema rosaneae TaxID=1620701 RepID=UPI003D6F7789
MKKTKFMIVLTAPLVITADGDHSKEAFAVGFSHLLKGKQIGLERKMISTKDNKKIKDLRGDILAIAFTFTIPVPLINSLCGDIANEIFQNDNFSPKLRILVEGSKDSSVISLSGIDSQELAETIQKIVTAV